jgi:Mg2+ and Co2+ transporter CorA
LSLLTALFLPATLVTGLFGMNTKGIPFADDDQSFYYALGIASFAALITYIALIKILRRRGKD